MKMLILSHLFGWGTGPWESIGVQWTESIPVGGMFSSEASCPQGVAWDSRRAPVPWLGPRCPYNRQLDVCQKDRAYCMRTHTHWITLE